MDLKVLFGGKDDDRDIKDKATKVKLMEQTMNPNTKRLTELYYARGYAEALKDLITMIAHMKGISVDDLKIMEETIDIKTLSDLMEIGIESLPLYQEFKKAKGR